MGFQQEQGAQRVLGGLCTGDGDPGGEPGRISQITCFTAVGVLILQLCTIHCLCFPLQVHVVRPVLSRIDALIQTTVNDSQGNTRIVSNRFMSKFLVLFRCRSDVVVYLL